MMITIFFTPIILPKIDYLALFKLFNIKLEDI